MRQTTSPVAAQIRPNQVADDGFVPLFADNSAKGWVVPFPSGRAVVRNGEVRLIGNDKFFLVSKQTFSDFILEADAFVPPSGNSGIQFRSQYRYNFVRGYQADVDTAARNWAGGLYFQGRGWLERANPRAPIARGKWNRYRIEAIGDHIQIFVNNVQTVDYQDARGAASGHLALQNHGGQGVVVRFRNVRIKEIAAESPT